jgi:hypothetical protein
LKLEGQRFGRLTALTRSELTKDGYLWHCRCDCGGEKQVLATHLRGGVVKSCGCLWREAVTAPRPGRRKRPYEHLYNRLWQQAREREIPCDMTYEEFVAFTAVEKCFYCTAPVEWAEVTTRSRNRINLDRTDNSLGYTAGNLVVCCWECNDGKGDRYTFKEWWAMATALRKVRGPS